MPSPILHNTPHSHTHYALPHQELWQGLLKEGDHWRDIYDDMHKVDRPHNHCRHHRRLRHHPRHGHREEKSEQIRMIRKQISGTTP